MKGTLKQLVLAGCVIAAGLACGKPKPIVPSKPVPAGTVLFQFTKKVAGPVDLTVDGIRVPVGLAGGKKCKHLSITGLAAGKHQLVLLSPLDAFGPDRIEVELQPTQGEFRLIFAQQFNSVLYGKSEPAPVADGIPGVKATLLP